MSERIFAEIETERARQNHGCEQGDDWLYVIHQASGQHEYDEQRARARLVKIAALAVAGIAAIDRQARVDRVTEERDGE